MSIIRIELIDKNFIFNIEDLHQYIQTDLFDIKSLQDLWSTYGSVVMYHAGEIWLILKAFKIISAVCTVNMHKVNGAEGTFMYNLITHKKYRRQGYATKLLTQIKKHKNKLYIELNSVELQDFYIRRKFKTAGKYMMYEIN